MGPQPEPDVLLTKKTGGMLNPHLPQIGKSIPEGYIGETCVAMKKIHFAVGISKWEEK